MMSGPSSAIYDGSHGNCRFAAIIIVRQRHYAPRIALLKVGALSIGNGTPLMVYTASK